MELLRFLVVLCTFLVSARCHIMHDKNLITHECLKNRAIAANYTLLGEVVQVGNLPVYETGSATTNTNRMLIGVYDIYGFAYDNLKHVMDEISLESGGFRVILPDFYRGESVNPNFTDDERQQWMQRVGDWDTIVKPDLINILNHYEQQGVQEFAIFGFCWGGKVSTLASTELGDRFKASGLVHPSSVTTGEAQGVQIPMYLMPSSNDLDMLPFYAVLQTKFGDNCGHRRFGDMVHGFAGARGNFSDPINQERVNEVITTLGSFFDRNLQSSNSNSNVSKPSVMFIVTFIAAFLFIVRR